MKRFTLGFCSCLLYSPSVLDLNNLILHVELNEIDLYIQPYNKKFVFSLAKKMITKPFNLNFYMNNLKLE